ncbi:MAG: hypothetical protein E7012_06610 [Alphaproteobacteria bacterium]|nr:hypothetical protein [Alphaproteobacteria bacterium]
MPQIILKINDSKDKIYNTENICCYIAQKDISSSQFQEISLTGKPLLILNDVEPSSDGVFFEVDSSKPIKMQIRPIREKIGTKKILGVAIEPTRHEAMLASETEPEFIAFRITSENLSKAKSVIDWYNDLFLIQSAIDLSAEKVDIKGIDVDFIIINSRDYHDFSC